MSTPDTHHQPTASTWLAPHTGSTQSTGATSPSSGVGTAFYLYIFNFDGVLANTARIYLDLCRTGLAACGHTRQLPSLEDLVGCERFDGEGLADAFSLPSGQREVFVKHVNSALNRSALACELYPGISLTLRTLSSTANTAVVSRSTPEFITTSLRANGVPRAINRTLGIDCGNPVDCIKQLLRELQIAPKRAVYCGDCVHDMHVARLAGVNAAACAWGWQGHELREHAQAGQLVFERPAQMLTALARPYQAQPDIVL
ncbi:MAG: HAD hydrolase-like protein [Pseudomonadota bacterium]